MRAKRCHQGGCLLIKFEPDDITVQVTVDEYLYDVNTLLADIGGYLGLSVGASFFLAGAAPNLCWERKGGTPARSWLGISDSIYDERNSVLRRDNEYFLQTFSY